MAMITMIKKRDGRQVPFNIEKIANAIFKAAQTVGGRDFSEAMALADKVCQRLSEEIIGRNPSVEDVYSLSCGPHPGTRDGFHPHEDI